MIIFLPNATVFTSNGEKIIQPLEVIEKRNNSEWFLECEFLVDDKDWVKQDYIAVVETKEKGKQPFRFRNIESGITIRCEAWHIGFDTQNYGVELATVVNGNCQTALNALKADSTPVLPFTLTSSISTLRSFSVENTSLYEGLVDIASRYNGYIEMNGMTISIVSSIGADNGVTLAYGKNIQESEVYENWDNVVTRLKPIGNDGLTVASSWLVADVQYDKPYAKIMNFDTDDINNLQLVAQLYLDRYKVPQVNYKVKADVVQNVGLGDIIQVNARQFTVMTEVIAYEFNVLTKRNEMVEFGNYRRTARSAVSDLRGSIETKIGNDFQLKIDDVKGEISIVSANVEGLETQIDIQAGLIETKVSATYVDQKIQEINQASPNRVSNLPDNYAQGDILSGVNSDSDYHIRTRAFYPIRTGFVTVQIVEPYQVKLVLYDSSFNYVDETSYGDLYTFSLSGATFFKAVVKRTLAQTIDVSEIETSQFKVANESSATAWNLYFGDYTLDAQLDLYQFFIQSVEGLTFDENTVSLTLNAVVLLNGVDTTELQLDNQFAWSRKSKDSAKDTAFNNLGLTGKELVLSSTYLDRSATYICTFSIPDTAYLLTFTGDRLLTFDGDYLVALVSEVV